MSAARIRIDIVSDIVCPWCAIGLAALETALERLEGVVTADITFHPLELNPGLPPGGEPIADNMARKYGATGEQARAAGGRVRAAAAEAGVDMSGRGDRIYDTFDAHRLLHWAAIQGRQLALKHALLDAYFARGEDVSDATVLAEAAARAGLDPLAAREILADGRYGEDVRAAEAHWRSEGVLSVPTIILEGRYVIPGAQSPERLEKALRRRAEAAADS